MHQLVKHPALIRIGHDRFAELRLTERQPASGLHQIVLGRSPDAMRIHAVQHISQWHRIVAHNRDGPQLADVLLDVLEQCHVGGRGAFGQQGVRNGEQLQWKRKKQYFLV